MTIIKNILVKYQNRLDYLDLELIIADALKKPREFVLAHPEYEIPKFKIQNSKFKISRRMRGEPLAYILGRKEFFGLNFRVNQHTLVPRPETELLVELALCELQAKHHELQTILIDVGTGSGNIIISVAKTWTRNVQNRRHFVSLYGTDISLKALKVAKQNARLHKVDKRIKFLCGNLLEPILKLKNQKLKTKNLMILANLPYLSKKIYTAAPLAVKKYEPKSALYSAKHGLAHYEKLLKQIKSAVTGCGLTAYWSGRRVTGFFEISPEQKPEIIRLIRSVFPNTKPEFYRDLARRWRVCKISL